MIIEWREEDWRRVLRSAEGFHVDAGFEVPSHVWSWLLPRGSGDGPRVRPPGLPMYEGHVLSADAFGREDVLAAFFAQFPKPPGRAERHDHAWANCFGVNVVLKLAGGALVVADTFGAGVLGADEVLARLADGGGGPAEAYDNLDQGWALRILIEGEWVIWLEWDWENEGRDRREVALRLPRATVAAQAAAARHRMGQVHRHLVEAFGVDLWRSGLGEV